MIVLVVAAHDSRAASPTRTRRIRVLIMPLAGYACHGVNTCQCVFNRLSSILIVLVAARDSRAASPIRILIRRAQHPEPRAYSGSSSASVCAAPGSSQLELEVALAVPWISSQPAALSLPWIYTSDLAATRRRSTLTGRLRLILVVKARST